jgi:hypothetical protein
VWDKHYLTSTVQLILEFAPAALFKLHLLLERVIEEAKVAHRITSAIYSGLRFPARPKDCNTKHPPQKVGKGMGCLR